MKTVTVLIVDDKQDICNLITEVLRLEGIQCESTTSFEAAKELIGSHRFNAMITDNVLGQGNGIELIEYAKTQANLKYAIMTGDMDFVCDITKFEKPFDFGVMVEFVKAAL